MASDMLCSRTITRSGTEPAIVLSRLYLVPDLTTIEGRVHYINAFGRDYDILGTVSRGERSNLDNGWDLKSQDLQGFHLTMLMRSI